MQTETKIQLKKEPIAFSYYSKKHDIYKTNKSSKANRKERQRLKKKKTLEIK